MCHVDASGHKQIMVFATDTEALGITIHVFQSLIACGSEQVDSFWSKGELQIDTNLLLVIKAQSRENQRHFIFSLIHRL